MNKVKLIIILIFIIAIFLIKDTYAKYNYEFKIRAFNLIVDSSNTISNTDTANNKN